ncbi:MAG: hypothetical protein A3I01_13595 [Betaproteobacteria bacterium RIFCSPLOWO2_02_FULL_65_24]|nr:MAG: hypothetical protein A3I01_13595 [Betaproteobacteria bacterium RIFCSPLOWO2_02_FULL_65_24]
MRVSAASVNPIDWRMREGAVQHLFAPRRDVRVEQAAVRATAERLGQLMALVASGALKPQIGRLYSLAETPAAYAASQSGRSRGKHIIRFEDPPAA